VATNYWDVNFATPPPHQNVGEINPQSMDDNFAIKPPDFVNVSFTKDP